MTATIMMMVVFLTCEAVGQVDAAQLGAHVAHELADALEEAVARVLGDPRSRRAGRPSCPSPYRAMRGAVARRLGSPADRSGSSWLAVICSSSLFDT